MKYHILTLHPDESLWLCLLDVGRVHDSSWQSRPPIKAIPQGKKKAKRDSLFLLLSFQALTEDNNRSVRNALRVPQPPLNGRFFGSAFVFGSGLMAKWFLENFNSLKLVLIGIDSTFKDVQDFMLQMMYSVFVYLGYIIVRLVPD